MDKRWTTPVILGLVFSFLCVVGTGFSGWISWQELQLMRHSQTTQTELGANATRPEDSQRRSGGTVNATPFIVGAIASLISVVLLGAIAFAAFKHTKAPKSERIPSKLPQITGSFSKVRIARYGVITETRPHGQRWIHCGLTIQVSASASGLVTIKDMRFATYGNIPHCRSWGIFGGLPVDTLDEKSSSSFDVTVLMDFEYRGTNSLPSSLELLVIDNYDVTHHLTLSHHDTLPSLPEPASSSAAL